MPYHPGAREPTKGATLCDYPDCPTPWPALHVIDGQHYCERHARELREDEPVGAPV